MEHRLELRTLVELARLGNARRTAESLGVSQSTVTDVLARVERSYGTRLFDRDRKGSRPTATGALVVEAARRALDVLDNAEREVGLLESFERGLLSIAAHPCLVETHLAPAVATLLEDNRNLHCQLHTAPPGVLVEWLRERRIELFVGFEPDGPCDDVTLEPIDTYAPVPFCRAGHPLAGGPPVGVRALRDYPLVTTEVPRWYHGRTDVFDPALMGELTQRGRRVNVAHLATMEALVATTDALGFAPRVAIADGLESGRFVEIGMPEDEQAFVQPAPVMLVTATDRPLPPSANALIRALRAAAVT